METGRLITYDTSKYLCVGVTGHRDLILEDKNLITTKVKELFAQIKSEHNSHIKLYSALAPGADIWVAECLDASDKLVVVKVLPDNIDIKYTFWGKELGDEPKKEDNENNLAYSKKLSDWQSRKNKHEKLWNDCLILKQRPNIKVEDLTSKQNLDYDKESVRNHQYILLGEYLVKKCMYLIALWDGVDGGGVGGTSDVVRMWQKGKGIIGNKVLTGKNKRVLYHLSCPREKNHFPINRF